MNSPYKDSLGKGAILVIIRPPENWKEVLGIEKEILGGNSLVSEELD